MKKKRCQPGPAKLTHLHDGLEVPQGNGLVHVALVLFHRLHVVAVYALPRPGRIEVIVPFGVGLILGNLGEVPLQPRHAHARAVRQYRRHHVALHIRVQRAPHRPQVLLDFCEVLGVRLRFLVRVVVP